MVEPKINLANFKQVEQHGRKPRLQENQVSIDKYRITIPIAAASKLDQTANLLYSDADKSIAIQKAADGEFQVKQLGKNKSTRTIYCRSLIETKKIKKGKYATQWHDKDEVLIAKVG